MILVRLAERGLIHPPEFLPVNTMYLVQMGSTAYGVSGESSDLDMYGFCIPPKGDVFPHLRGEIFGFGRQKRRFENWQEHHVEDRESRVQYDFSVFSIVRFFQLVMENNPNMVDALFVPQRCISHITAVGNMVRERRDLFLHKGCWSKFKGYAYSQLSKMDSKEHKYFKELCALEDRLGIPRTTTFVQAQEMGRSPGYEGYLELYAKMVQAGKRSERVKVDGWDRKFGYHVLRLLSEAEQILAEGTLVLDEVGRREQMKAVRGGALTRQQIQELFEMKEKQLEKLYHESKLPWGPDEERIKALLFECLEHHYGSLDKCVVRDGQVEAALRQIAEIIDQNRSLI